MNDDAAVVQSSSAVTPGRSSPIWWILPSLATAALAYTIVWTASYPGVLMIGAGLVFLLFGAASLLWLVCIGQLAARARLVATIVGFTLVVGSIGSTVAGMPQRVRFAASKAAFEAVVADANAHLPTRPPQAVILSTRKIHRLDSTASQLSMRFRAGRWTFRSAAHARSASSRSPNAGRPGPKPRIVIRSPATGTR